MLLIKTVALLCSATAAMAANAVASGAIFVGKDITDPSANPIQIYRDPDNHATAAASVLVFAANLANFHPTLQEPKALGQNLDQFVTKVAAFPAFVTTNKAQHSLELDGSLTQFELTVGELLEDPDTARAIRGLVPDNVQDEDESFTDWVLSLIVVTKPDDEDTVNIRLAQVCLTILSDGNTATIPEQSARLTVSDFQVDTLLFVSSAVTFASRIPIFKVSDFTKFFTSPKSFFRGDQVQRGSTSCSKNRQTLKDRQAILPQIL